MMASRPGKYDCLRVKMFFVFAFLVNLFTMSWGQSYFNKLIAAGTDAESGFQSFQLSGGDFITLAKDHSQSGIIFLRLNSVGDTLVHKKINFPFRSWGGGLGKSAIFNGVNGIFVIGSLSDSLDHVVSCLTRFDLNGNVQFHREYDLGNISSSYGICQYSSDSLAITGVVISTTNSDEQVYLLLTDQLGDSVSYHEYGSAGDQAGFSVHQTQDSGFIIGGISHSSSVVSKPYAIKTDKNGIMKWQKYYGPNLENGGAHIIELNNGDLLLAGSRAKKVGIFTETDAYVARLTSNGGLIWESTFGGDGDNNCQTEGFELNDGSLIVSGMDWGDRKAWIRKLDATGANIWHQELNSPTNLANELIDVVQTLDGGFLVTGQDLGTSNSGFSFDIWVEKLDSNGCSYPNCPVVGVNSILQEDFLDLLIYPNPFAQEVFLEFGNNQLKGNMNFVSLYDVNMRLVFRNDWDGNGSFSIPSLGLRSGLYFLSVESSTGKVFTKTLLRQD